MLCLTAVQCDALTTSAVVAGATLSDCCALCMLCWTLSGWGYTWSVECAVVEAAVALGVWVGVGVCVRACVTGVCVCSVCLQLSHLSQHVRAVHDGLKPFVCPQDGCHKAFPYKVCASARSYSHMCMMRSEHVYTKLLLLLFALLF